MRKKAKYLAKKPSKRALRIDFFREIQKSFGRFLSIFLIVALGVGLFAGISSTESDMIQSGDLYADENYLMDIKVVSTYGMTEKDLNEIRTLSSIETAIGSYSTDVLTPVGDDMRVLHLLSFTESMNMLDVVEGRLPETPEECVMDLDLLTLSGYRVGDTISLRSGTEAELTDTLACSELVIVGSVTTPLYFSVIRESSAIGNGTVAGYAVVHPELFSMDVYTEVYATVKGAREATAFTPEYDALIDQAIEEIMQIEDVRCKVRREELIQKGRGDIEDVRSELNDKISEAESEIEENKQLLVDAEEEWSDGSKQIEDAKLQLEDGWKQYEESKGRMNVLQLEWNQSNEELSRKRKELESAKAELDAAVAEANTQKQTLLQQLEEVKTGIGQLDSGIQELNSSIAQVQSALDSLNSEVSVLTAQYNEKQSALSSAQSALSEKESQKSSLQQQIASLKESLATLPEDEQESVRNQIQALEAELAQVEAAIPSLASQVESARAEFQAAESALNQKNQEKAPVEQQFNSLSAQLSELQTSRGELVQNKAALEEGIAQIEGTIAAYTAEYSANAQKLEDAQKELSEARIQLAGGWHALDEAKKALEEKGTELAEAQQKLAEALLEIEDGQQELASAQQTLESERADAEQKISEAEEEISNIALPTWYVFDRSAIPEYTAYGDNAERLAALALVFPSIFFLVAAMISLTTMTRMVEEQRTQIGTLKALGYSNLSIMGKFFNYALFSTLSGSILGVLVGEKLFPFILISAYCSTVYTHLPYILLPYQWGYGIAATFAACFFTGGAALLASYKELLAHPAVLMRPEAPKGGKRTLVERIPFLWKLLNFSWKSSIRNLFRYKKRFFMTLFGIGGCMALLMVGFGLRDSITSIVDFQYGELHLYDGNVTYADSVNAERKEELTTFLSGHTLVAGSLDSRMGVVTAHFGEKQTDSYLVVLSDPEAAGDFLQFRNRETKAPCKIDDTGIVITEKAASLLGISVGDTIELSEEGINERTAKVTGICENYAAHYIYMSSQAYEAIYGEAPRYNNLFFKVTSDTGEAEIEALGEQILEFEDVLGIQYTSATEAQLMGMVISMNLIMVALIVVAGMLSFVVLYNLNNINITERRREMATLKVLGFRDMEVANYVYRENSMLTVFGILIGCGLGKYLHYFTVITIEADTAMFGRDIAPISYLFGILLTIAFSSFVNWMMYFKLKKIDMVESLKSVE